MELQAYPIWLGLTRDEAQEVLRCLRYAGATVDDQGWLMALCEALEAQAGKEE